jgi:hypothetical protein
MGKAFGHRGFLLFLFSSFIAIAALEFGVRMTTRLVKGVGFCTPCSGSERLLAAL